MKTKNQTVSRSVTYLLLTILIATAALWNGCDSLSDTYVWYKTDTTQLFINYPKGETKLGRYTFTDSVKVLFKMRTVAGIERFNQSTFTLTLPSTAVAQTVYVMPVLNPNSPAYDGNLGTIQVGGQTVPDGRVEATPGQTITVSYTPPATLNVDSFIVDLKIVKADLDGSKDNERVQETRNKVTVYVFKAIKPIAKFTITPNPSLGARQYIFDASQSLVYVENPAYVLPTEPSYNVATPKFIKKRVATIADGKVIDNGLLKNYVYIISLGDAAPQPDIISDTPLTYYPFPGPGNYRIKMYVVGLDGDATKSNQVEYSENGVVKLYDVK